MTELGQATHRQVGSIVLIGAFSTFVNALMLTGPLFMLQVYDRVLSSRSEATLVTLFLLVAGLYAAMGILDFTRGRIGARIGADLQDTLDRRVFSAAMSAPEEQRAEAASATGDLESIRRFFSAPVSFALFDILFTPLFLAGIFLFHPLLGWLAVFGAIVLLLVSMTNQWLSRLPTQKASTTSLQAQRWSDQMRTQPETVATLGMRRSALRIWQAMRLDAMHADLSLSDRNGGFGSFSKAIRLFLQSAMLALGAWLVLQNELTPGAMIAGSILLGRALAPIELLIGSWVVVAKARRGWKNLRVLLHEVPEPAEPTRLHRPAAKMSLTNVSVVAPGQKRPVLRGITCSIGPGEALAVVGDSASGKSSLARVLTGYWKPYTGKITLDGAALEHFSEEDRASYIGYLPQDVVMFTGSIAQNIARFQEAPDSADVIAAATKAGAHDMILGIPDGYDARIGTADTALSGGQRQRIGLARALFGVPAIVVLDEPNSNLDSQGSQALNAAIRELKADGCAVVVMAHRPSAIAECDRILLLRHGQVAAYGPREEILPKILPSTATDVPSGVPA